MSIGKKPKSLVMITGAPGVGKTTIAKEVFKSIDGCAWLDADWCWMINPWIDKTQGQKQYSQETITRILRGHLENDHVSVVLFSWLMRTTRMFELVTDPLKDFGLNIVKIALVCDGEAHIKRKMLDGRREEQVYERSSMDSYYNLGADVIDTTDKTAQESAGLIRGLIEKEEID